MKLLPYLILPVVLAVSSVAEASAQEPTPAPRPVFSSALWARLHAQILALAPRLRLTFVSSEFSGLALSAARLGDFDLALRLAKSSFERDELWKWRTAQLASTAKGEAALEASSHIQDIYARGEALLVAARFAVDKRRPELAQRNLKVFSNLRNERPSNRPAKPFYFMDGTDSQLAYGGYLWARANQPDAARRLWKRAWPLFLTKAQHLYGGQVGRRENSSAPLAPQDLQARVQAEAAREILPFIAHSGMIGDVLPYLHLDNSSFPTLFRQAVMAARTSSQRQILRAWLLAHQSPASSEKWKLLAMAEAYEGNMAKSREDYSHATPSPPQKANTAQDVSAGYELTLANAWNDDAFRLEAEERLRVQLGEFVQSEDVEMMLLSSRLTTLQNGQLKVPPMTRDELASATDKLLALVPGKVNPDVLRIVAKEWHARGENEQVVRVARAMAKAEHAQMTVSKSQSASNWESVRRFRDILQGATWLRFAGREEEADAVAQQFAQDAPTNFRCNAALILWKSGFAKASEAIFDPLAELKKQQLAPRAQRQGLLALRGGGPEQEFSDWEELTAAQARFVAPDAPARWFGSLPSIELKAHVLAAWIKALSPNAPDEALSIRSLSV